jgi:hypothetical protein
MKKNCYLLWVITFLGIIRMQAQNVLPYFPLEDNFGGSEITGLNEFCPSVDDYTLEVTAAGGEIRIPFASIAYTPGNAGSKVRFVQKDGKVYVFEAGVFKTVLTPNPQYAPVGNNLIQNPSFETVESEVLADGRWKPAVWDTWDGGKATWGGDIGKTNVRENAAYRSDGVKSIIMHHETRQLLQGLPANALEANAFYLLTYDYWTSEGSGNGGTTYQIFLRNDRHTGDFQTMQGHTTLTSGTAKSSFSTLFQAPADIPSSVWFVLARSETKVDWLDNFKMTKINPAATGITGAGSAVYLNGTAFAPGNLSLENGDYIDLTAYIVNPGFDDATSGWTIDASGSKISTAEKEGGLISGSQNHLQFYVSSGGVNGKLRQVITGLINGKYTLKAAIAPYFSGSVSLYANTGKTTVISGTSKYYEATGIVFEGALEIGLEMNTSGSPTIDIDDFQLLYSGTDAEAYRQVLDAKIAEAKADTALIHTASTPGYSNLQQYREALAYVGNLPDSEAATLIAAINLIKAAIDEYNAIQTAYTPLKAAINSLLTQLSPSKYPNKGDVFGPITASAQAVYNSPEDQRGNNIASAIASLSQASATLTAYKELETLISISTANLEATHYAGENAFRTVIDAAQAIYANPDGKDLPAAVETLKKANTAYYNSQYTEPAVQQTVSWVDISLNGSEKFVLRVDGTPFYMTNIQVRLDKLYGYEGWPDAALEAVVKRAADDGFNTVSIPVHWKEVEPEKDCFDWTILDKFMGWCKKYNLKMELLWFSWSSGGRVQYLMNTGGIQTPRTPDYVCSLNGTSEFNMLRKEWEYSLDWRDMNLCNREKYVLGQIMEHVAVWEANNGQPHTVIGVQLGNEARAHGNNTATASEIINYYHIVGAAVKESKHVVWTRLNCVSYETSGRISANEAKRNSGGTNIDFVGIDIYGTSASSIKGNMSGYLPHTGKNYSMIMEIDAKDSSSPLYQMSAIAGNKAFDYYNMGFVDGNGLYSNSGTTLVERDHITEVRQRNKILNLANRDIALKAHGNSLFVYNYAGNSTAAETGIENIRFTPNAARTQAIAIRRSPSEIVLLSTLTGTFTLPASLKVVSASKGYFDKNNAWVKEGDITLNGTSITMPATAAVLLKLTDDLTLIPALTAENKDFSIIGCKDGILITCHNERQPADAIHIYSVTGQIKKTVSTNERRLFVPLTKGLYIVNKQKVIVK